MTWDHASLHRIQVASNCILRTQMWLNKAILCPTGPTTSGPLSNLSRQVLQDRGQAWLPTKASSVAGESELGRDNLEQQVQGEPSYTANASPEM